MASGSLDSHRDQADSASLESRAGLPGSRNADEEVFATEEERQRVVETFNATETAYPKGKLIHELIEEQVERTPETVAVVYEGLSLTYAELNSRANHLAEYLMDREVGPEQLVGICLERSLEMLVALLGVLKAGGAYVPLDPGYPAERIAYMLKDAAPRVILIQEHLRGRVASSNAQVVALDDGWDEIARTKLGDASHRKRGLLPDHLAYVIYTSGSTGQPKGAMNEHRAVVNRLLWMQQQYRLGSHSRILQKTPFSFDVSVWEFFWPLMTGARLCVARPGGHQDPRYLRLFIEEQQITTVHFVPSMLRAFLEEHETGRCPTIRHIVCSGEELPPVLQDQCMEKFPLARLSNLYGPTECAVDVTAWECVRAETARIPIGHPIANTRIYVLNSGQQPVPIGVPGEIYIAGTQVGRGYWRRPDLTADRFVADPFTADPQGRMYRTGDLGKWRRDGAIEYLGRNDDQVKVRGFRIELGEIEAQLARHSGVREAIVVPREDVAGDKRLVAYLIARDASQVPSVEGLREHLTAVLPEYMVPSGFVVLDSFPLSPNGKLNRRALPAPDLSSYASGEYEPPRGKLEELLAEIWQELLTVGRVGRNDNFFALGGHSLLVMRMLSRLRREGLRCEVQGAFQSPTLSALALELKREEGLEVEVPPNHITAGCDRIAPEMLPLVSLTSGEIERIVQTVPGGAANVQDIYPLAPLQEGILFHHLLDHGGAGSYLLSTLLSVSSRKRLEELISALQAIIERHDVLRTAILWEDLPRAVQVVYRHAVLSVEELALDGERNAEEQVREWLRPERWRMDLRLAPLMRLRVAADPCSERCYVLLQLHHIICDAVTVQTLSLEAVAHLSGATSGSLEAVPFRDHVAQALVRSRTHDARRYFQAKLRDIDEPTAPFGLLDVHGDGSEVEHAIEVLPLTLAARLRTQVRRRGLSAAALFHAAWALVVSRTSGREDVVYGTVLLGRTLGSMEAERTLGVFINTLPLRISLGGLTAQALLECTQSGLVELLTHEQASLAEAQRCSGVSGSAPLFTTLLNYRHSAPDPRAQWGNAAGIETLGWAASTNYPITISVDDLGDGFTLTAQTDRRLAPRRVLSYLQTTISSLIEALEQRPETAALTLEVLPTDERRQIIEVFNATEATYPSDKLVQQLFEEQVERTPQAEAIVYEGETLTYAELNRRANQLARALRRRGVEPGEYVPILVVRSLRMVIAKIAVLKCGAAYVPLDPTTPNERLAFLIADCRARYVIAETLPGLGLNQCPVEWIDFTTEPIADLPTQNLKLATAASAPAYVMYTSGSTGQPKGVIVSHRAVNRLAVNNRYATIVPSDCIPHCSNPAFDASTFEIWGTLLNGAKLLIVPQSTVLDAARLGDLLLEHQATVLWLTVGLFNQYQNDLAEVFGRLRYLITGGDVVEPAMARRVLHRSPPQQLLNAYGPTECTTFATTFRLDELTESDSSIPIGKPISNTTVYILDSSGRPTPIGVIGELYIGGPGVALGYLNCPELTAERFVPDPFAKPSGARMYRTGDLGRWRADGNVDFCGRKDKQVKIRGFRIEPGEIEAQLARHPAVKEAAVLVVDGAPGGRRLVAYVVPESTSTPLTAGGLREHLKGMLPEYMVPSAFVLLEMLPLTTNGKVDRRALPAPDQLSYASREYEPPQGDVEELLAAIWQELLLVERVGRNDHFFALGGHSLLIVQMKERLRRVGLSCEIRSVFESSTLSGLARELTRGMSAEVEPPANCIPLGCERITPEMLPLVDLTTEDIGRIAQAVPGSMANIQDIYPLAPLQEGMLFHHLFDRKGRDSYVLSTLLSVSSREHLRELISALQAVIDRHDVLRTAVVWEGLPRAVQVVYREATLPVEQVELNGDRDVEGQVREWLRPEPQRMDLRRAPLMRLRVAADPSNQRWYVLQQLHHIVCDHVTADMVNLEVAAYLACSTGGLPDPVPYRNHVAQTLADARAHDARTFFRGKLGDIDEPTAPFGLLDVHGDGSEVDEVSGAVVPALAARLRTQARRHGVSAATLFHAAWALVVSRTSGRNDVVYGTVLLGRMQGSAGAQRILGVFINTLPLRLPLQGLSAQMLVERTQRELVELLSHEQASLAEAQRCSGIIGTAPLFTALLNYRHSAPNLEGQWSSAGGVEQLGEYERTNYPIMVSVDDVGEGFIITAQTDRRIAPPRILVYLNTAIASLVEALELSSQKDALMLDVLPDEERQQIVEIFNATDTPYRKERLIHELFEECAIRAPDAVAVVCDGQRLTYAELNARANQLAWYLRAKGIGPDDLVGICLERTIELVIGILGILKSGGAYLPLDPGYPSERLAYILADASPKVVLIQERLRCRIPSYAVGAIALDSNWPEIARQDAANLSARTMGLSPGHLAYVIYTSGSTGTPKGVAAEHHSMTNRITAQRLIAPFAADDVCCHKTSIGFVDAVFEILGPLCYGRPLAIAQPSVGFDPLELPRFIRKEQVTRLISVPSLARALLDNKEAVECLQGIRGWTLSGEELPSDLLLKLHEALPACRFVNLYGSSEVAGDATCYVAQAFEGGRVPIGKPIQNAKVYILDSNCRPVPLGQPGEIHVSGAGLARGYYNHSELTAERFVKDPFNVDPNARMFKTGDLGCWREDGTIDYLGRNDDQVKIRGFRIELGEIGAQLARRPEVKDAVVVAREDVPGEKRLVGYVVPMDPANPPDYATLRQHLKAALPEYMVPSAILALDSLPLTPNGKLDRRALPAPEFSSYAHSDDDQPRGEVEEILAGIWQELLHVGRIGRNDNFFALGGHSLLLVQMMERLRRVGLSCEMRRVFGSPTLSELAGALRGGVVEVGAPPNLIPPQCARIEPRMLPLIDLEPEHIECIVHAVPGGSAAIQDIYPLAPLQEGILFHHLLDVDGSDTYVLSSLLSVSSRERLDELICALQAIIDTHDVLRTAVMWEGLPRAVQVVYRRAALPVEEVKLDGQQDAEAEVRSWLTAKHQQFDLRRAPLMRLKIASDPRSCKWYVLQQIHHIACDRVTASMIISEVIAQLEGRLQLLPAVVPYRDHVAQALAYARGHDAVAFFRGKLADIDEPTAPFGLLDVRGDGWEVDEANGAVDPAVAARLRAQARRHGVSAATLFHAAWALVVSRSCGRDDVVYGTVLLGRMQGSAGGQRILGVFINTLPLRLPLRGLSAQMLVERTQRELVELLSHEQASLAEAQRASSIPGAAPLFTTLLNYRHNVSSPETQWSGAAGINEIGWSERTNYPIAISVDDVGEGFMITAQTDRRIASRQMLAYMRTAIASLVDALELFPEKAALALEVLPDEEKDQVVRVFNATEARYPEGRLIHELFEEQVVRTPEAEAAVCEGRSLTYADLNGRANRLAWYLRARGVGPDRLVGICLERSIEMLVGLLGTLKAGGAYLPLDPSYPSERLRYMLDDAAPTVVLTEQKLMERLPRSRSAMVAIDTDWEEIDRCSAQDLTLRPYGLCADSLAYVIYTSGSTGRPKGVQVSHKNLQNLVSWHVSAFDLRRGVRCSSVAAIGFDAATWEIWPPISCGATLVLAGQTLADDVGAMISWWRDEPLDVCFMPTPIAELAFAGDVMNQRIGTLLVGGDRLRHRPKGQRYSLINNYGPTECTVVATSGRIFDEDDAFHIGRPIANAKVYILSDCGQLVPVGVAGEIHIGGAGVAKGYLNRPDLTVQRFLPDHFSPDSSARMYRTGDLGRWRPDGTVEYLGRNDDQVKIRGFRIEPGEIEAQLMSHSEVKEAVVVTLDDLSGDKRLVGYVVPRSFSNPPATASLREHLKMVVPEYMVPSAFVTLENLPLTPNGKLNRRALPAPKLSSYVSTEYEPPQGEVEEALAGIWRELLRVDRVGRNDNFFALGGHSLLIVQMMERLRRLGLATEIRQVFESPTLMALAGSVVRGSTGQLEVPPNLIPADCEVITPQMLPLVELTPEQIDELVQTVPGGVANLQDIYPLAPLQEGILFHHLLDQTKGDTYLLPELLSVSSRNRLEELIVALQSLIDRHDVLRTALVWEHLPRPVQVVYRKAALPVEVSALDPERDAEEQIREWLKPEQQRMDLRRAPLMRLKVAADPHSERWYVLKQLHHIVCDNVTERSLSSEVAALLRGQIDKFPEELPYRSYVAQTLAYARTHDARAFFCGKLASIEEPTAPFGLLDVHGDGAQIAEAREKVDPTLAMRLRTQARSRGVTAATLFHAAWTLVVSRTSGRDDVVYGTVLLGRMQGSARGRRALGVFINTLPLRVKLQGLSTQSLVECTQRELVELLSHEQASLAEAQRCSGIRGTGPLFTALFNYRHGVLNPDVQWDGVGGIEELGGYGHTNYPITVSVDDAGDGFIVTAQTDPRIAPKRLLAYVQTAVSTLIEALEQRPGAPALSLDVLPAQEWREVINAFNASEVSYPKGKLIHELFEEQVERTPEAVAVEHEGRSLTYVQLNRQANQLARYLISQGVAPDALVGICLERGVEMVVGLLAILKAGGTYLPLDPNYPPERLRHMLRDSAPSLVLTQTELVGALPESEAQIIAWDERRDEVAAFVAENVPVVEIALTPDNLVYVIYTSGSTGRPKGTAMRHGSVVNLITWHRHTLGCLPGERVLQFAALSFDVASQEILSTVCTGGTLVLLDEWVRRDARALTELLEDRSIQRLFIPPLMLQSIAEYCHTENRIPKSLKDVITAGEQLRISAEIRSLFGELAGCRLHNHYGPTETHVVTALTLAGDPEKWPDVPAIGRPIANTQIYLLDARMRPVPSGAAGEIYIGGAGVARGYLNRPELTAERFVRDPFGGDPTALMYKTGDLGRWRPDGSIEYLGRNDDQVKIRGFRIELGEIAAQLVRHGEVKEAVVVAREDAPGEKRLVSYVIPRDISTCPAAEVLREHLKATLPDYMVPSAFVMLETIPVTPNGKIDRRALPPPDLSACGSREHEPPEGVMEEMVAGIWEQLLHLERVGRSDNFFAIGGHSLLGMKAINAVREKLGVQLSMSAIFKHPTVQSLAEAITLLRATEMHDAPRIDSGEFEEGSIDLAVVSVDRIAKSAAPAFGREEP